MAHHTVTGQVDEPIDQVAAELRKEAAAEDWSLAEGAGDAHTLVFRKGLTATSWGAELSVELDAETETRTKVTVRTHETWAITDWGRGSRAARRLLTAIGADID